MMKKTIPMLLMLIFVMTLFTGTSSFAEETENESTQTLSKAEIVAMSNFMNRGGVSRDGKWTVRVANDNGNLRMRSLISPGDNSSLIGKADSPAHFIMDGLFVYYISNATTNRANIHRIRVSGGCDEMLIDNAKVGMQGIIDFLFEYDDHLYFAVNNESTVPATGSFFRADKDGENITPILEKAVYYPYVVNGKLYYQDDADYCRLHVCNPDGTGDQVLIDDFCYDYFTDGETFYYTSFNGDVEWDENHRPLNINDLTRALKIYNPESGTKVVPEVQPQLMAFDGDRIYYSAMDDSGRLYSYDPAAETIDVLCFNDWIGHITIYNDSTLLCVDTSGQYFEDILFVATDGSSVSRAA